MKPTTKTRATLRLLGLPPYERDNANELMVFLLVAVIELRSEDALIVFPPLGQSMRANDIEDEIAAHHCARCGGALFLSTMSGNVEEKICRGCGLKTTRTYGG